MTGRGGHAPERLRRGVSRVRAFPTLERYSKPTRECRPGGSARVVGPGQDCGHRGRTF